MHLPAPLSAVVGLAASVADEARHLPDRAIELPMLAVSTALQASLRAQQRYSRLAARGDAVLNRRTPTQEPPPWATFDEPVEFDTDEVHRSTFDTAFDDAPPPSEPPPSEPPPSEAPPAEPAPSDPPPVKKPPSAQPPVKSAKKAARKTSAKADKRAPAGAAGKKEKKISKPRHTAPSAFDNVPDGNTDSNTDGGGPSGPTGAA